MQERLLRDGKTLIKVRVDVGNGLHFTQSHTEAFGDWRYNPQKLSKHTNKDHHHYLRPRPKHKHIKHDRCKRFHS